MDDSKEISDIIHNFEEVVKHPDKFVSFQNEKAKKIEEITKKLYDFTKNTEDRIIQRSDKGQNTLPSLILENFDSEQIWGQITLQNDDTLNYLVPAIAALLAKKKLVFTTIQNKKDKVKKKLSQASNLLNNCESDDNDYKEVKHSKPTSVKKVKSSIVDDKFFKLSEMEDYLNNIEKGIENENEDSDDEPVDYFAEDLSDAEDADQSLCYDDFFDQPEDVDSVKASNSFNLENEDDDSDNDNEDNISNEDENDEGNISEKDEYEEENISEKDEDEESNVNEKESNEELEQDDDFSDEQEDPEQLIKSSFEARQERLKARIAALEEEALKDKPWQLKGEVAGFKRPQNSLLEEYVEFDIASRPAPIITEKTSLKLEDVIRQRIKDKVWDDVVRKVKPVEDPKEYKKKLVLNQEKSKLTLSEIYEQEYLKEKNNMEKDHQEVEEAESNERIEIKKAMKVLFSKLDALSNFHYTPKQAAPEVRIVSHLPAVVAEEVAPVATSDATLLAPEEIKAKPKGDLIGKSERTSTDKKRERRKKILRQRSKRKEKEKQEKLVEKLQPGMGNKYSIEKAKMLLDKVSKEKNVSQMDQKNGKHVKSSDAFFSKLQDEVTSQIKRKAQDVTDLNKQKKFSAKKIKL